MLGFEIMDKDGNDSLRKQEELVSNRDLLNTLQIFLDNNIRIIRVSLLLLCGKIELNEN